MKRIPNIIFLDVDGVLNCQLFYKEQKEKGIKRTEENWNESQIDNMRIAMLNDVCEKSNAYVIISGSIRKNHTLKQLQKIFKNCGATFTIIGKTPITGYERGTEISKWISKNIKIENHGIHYYDYKKYVIIDDDSDMLLRQAQHFFQTDNYSGLTPTTCYKIKNFFKQWNQ